MKSIYAHDSQLKISSEIFSILVQNKQIFIVSFSKKIACCAERKKLDPHWSLLTGLKYWWLVGLYADVEHFLVDRMLLQTFQKRAFNF